ncbi:MAG: pilin [Patescibacteria group bacterium]|jgi:hypothetical protein
MIFANLITFQIHNPFLPDVTDPDQAPALLGQTLSNILTLLFIVAGAAFFFMFVLGGVKWIASGGDKEKIEGARKQITAAIVGLVLILSVFAIVGLLNYLFGISLIKFNLPRLTQEQSSSSTPNPLPTIPPDMPQLN